MIRRIGLRLVCALWRRRGHPGADKRRGRSGALDEPEERPEVPDGGEPCHVQPGDAGLERLVQQREAIRHLDLYGPEIRHPGQVGLVARGEDDPIYGQTLAVRERHGLLVDPYDLRSRPTVNAVPGQPRREPPLEGKPADLPELPLDGVALFLPKPAPPTSGPQRFVDVLVDESPADLSESR